MSFLKKAGYPYVEYSILKASEGGMGQATALFLLSEARIKAEKATSIYVGHTAVRVFGTKDVQRKAARILYGKGVSR